MLSLRQNYSPRRRQATRPSAIKRPAPITETVPAPSCSDKEFNKWLNSAPSPRQIKIFLASMRHYQSELMKATEASLLKLEYHIHCIAQGRGKKGGSSCA